MRVSPRHLNNGTHIPNTTTQPAMLLKLPLVPNPGAPGTFTLNHNIHDGNARDVVGLINRLMLNSSAVQMGILEGGYNNQEAYNTWLKMIKDHL